MWCVTDSSLGLISTEVTHVSLAKPVGVVSDIHSMTSLLVFAGTVYGTPGKMMSGLAVHPFSGHCRGGGTSFSSPAGAPESAHSAIVSMSFCLREGSFENWL